MEEAPAASTSYSGQCSSSSGVERRPCYQFGLQQTPASDVPRSSSDDWPVRPQKGHGAGSLLAPALLPRRTEGGPAWRLPFLGEGSRASSLGSSPQPPLSF